MPLFKRWPLQLSGGCPEQRHIQPGVGWRRNPLWRAAHRPHIDGACAGHIARAAANRARLPGGARSDSRRSGRRRRVWRKARRRTSSSAGELASGGKGPLLDHPAPFARVACLWGHVNVVESCFLAAAGSYPSWAPCCDSRRVSDGCRCPRHAAVQELHKVRGLAGCVGRCNTVAAQHRNAGRWARLGGVVARESLHREPWTRPRASQAPGARVAHRAGAVLRRVGPSNPRAHKRHTSCG